MDPNLAAYAAQNREEQQEEGGLLDALGKIALGAGALAAGAIGARRLAQGLKTGATVDLSSFSPKNVRRVAAEYLAPKEVVPPSRPAPTTAVQRQQETIEFTRQARAERPTGVRQGNLEDMIKQVKVEDLGPTYSPINPEEVKRDLSFINNVLIPMEQKRLPSATEFLQERLQGQVTKLPSGYYSRTPSTFKEFSSDPGRALLFDIDLLKRVEAEELESEMRLPEARAEQARQQAQVRRAYSAKAEEALTAIRAEANTATAAAQGDFATQYLKTAGYTDAVTMVDQQAGNLVAQIDHFANASNSAEDQVTGRVKTALQRNEDENLAAIEMAEDAVDSQIARRAQSDPTVASVTEVDAAINQVADSLPDGRPIDQAEGINLTSQAFAQQAVAKQRFKSSSVREPLLDVEYKMYDLVAAAAEKGLKLEPSRALQILTNPNTELSFAEQNLFKVNPQLGKFALKGQTFDVGQEQTGASLGLLEEKLKALPNVGEQPTSAITQAASGTEIRGRSRIPNIPEESRLRISSSGRPLEADEVFIDEGGTLTVSPGAELTEVVFPSKEPTYTRFVRTPETQRPSYFGPGLASAEQLKVGLKPEYAPKGMRAVETQEGKIYFIPISDPGGVGIYGEERSFASGPLVKFDEPEQGRAAGTYTKTAMRAPTEMPFKEKQPGGAGFSEMTTAQVENFVSKAPEGRVREAGLQELSRRQATKQSVEVSEALRRARIEGRDPQSVLRSLGFGV